MSKLGVHVVQGQRNGYGEFLSRCAGAGQPVPIVKAVDDFAPCREAKSYSASTITVGRFSTIDQAVNLAADPIGEARRWWDEWQRRALVVDTRGVDIWENLNEISSHWGWQADFTIELARVSGLRLAMYCFSTGNPPRRIDDGGVAYSAVARCCAAMNGRGAVLSLHQYGGVGTSVDTLKGTEPYHAMRHRDLADYLKVVNGFVTPMILSECAQNGGFQYAGLQVFSDDFAWYDSELMKDSYVIGATAYTLGNWAQANFQDALPWLTEHIISHPTPGEPPPPPPEPAPTRSWKKLVILVPQQTTPEQYDEAGSAAYPTKTEVAFSADSAFSRPAGVTGHKVIVYNAELWGGQERLQAWVNTYYAYDPPTLVEWRQFSGTTPPPTQGFTLSSPLTGFSTLEMTSKFGDPRDYGPHEGVDFRVWLNGVKQEVIAAHSGRVVGARDIDDGAYGVYVMVDYTDENGDYWLMAYAHGVPGSVAVNIGDTVSKGQRLMTPDNTGNSTGDHLHFHLIKNRVLVDPVPYLTIPVKDVSGAPVPSPEWSGFFGVGTGRSGDLTTLDVNTLRVSMVNALKGATNVARDWSWIAKSIGILPEGLMCRLYWDASGVLVPPSPEDFVSWMRLPINEQRAAGVNLFELLNEPNVEYLHLWNSDSFAHWLSIVSGLLISEFPGIGLVSPGLSPKTGGAWDTLIWMNAMKGRGVFDKCLLVGAHSYWFDSVSKFDRAHGRYFENLAGYIPPNKKMAITEFSNNRGNDSDAEKGRQYLAWKDALPSYVSHAYSFCLTSDDPLFNERRETWGRGGGPTDIAKVVGGVIA